MANVSAINCGHQSDGLTPPDDASRADSGRKGKSAGVSSNQTKCLFSGTAQGGKGAASGSVKSFRQAFVDAPWENPGSKMPARRGGTTPGLQGRIIGEVFSVSARSATGS